MAQPTPDGPGLRRPATLADLVAVPPTHTGHLIDGKLYTLPRPRFRHSRAQGALHGALFGPFDQQRGGPGGWLLLIEPELRLGGSAIVPDLAGWRREGLDLEQLDPYPTVAPAWACEVLSPSTEAFDRGLKADALARHGVEWLWFVDPEARTLEAYRNDARSWRPAGNWQGAAIVTAPPFEALSWSLGLLWGLSGFNLALAVKDLRRPGPDALARLS